MWWVQQGRPRGSKNRATTERLTRMITQFESDEGGGSASTTRSDDCAMRESSDCIPRPLPELSDDLESPLDIFGQFTMDNLQHRSWEAAPLSILPAATLEDDSSCSFSITNEMEPRKPDSKCECAVHFLEVLDQRNQKFKRQSAFPLEPALLALKSINDKLSKLQDCQTCRTSPSMDLTSISASSLRFALRRVQEVSQNILSTQHRSPDHSSTASQSQNCPSAQTSKWLPVSLRAYEMTSEEESLVGHMLLHHALESLGASRGTLEARAQLLGVNIDRDPPLQPRKSLVPSTLSVDQQYLQHILEDVRQLLRGLSHLQR